MNDDITWKNTLSPRRLTRQLSTDESLDALLGEVAGEFFDRMNNGEQPRIEDYVARYPEIAEQIRAAFPALQVVGDSNAESTGPRTEVELTAQKTLGDFRILHELGRGGMGVVYEAEQLSMGRRVALKVLPFAVLAQERSLQRFRNEVRAAGSLNHPNIVPIYAVGEERGVHFFAMQLVRGQTMAGVIAHLVSLKNAGRPLHEDSIGQALSASAARADDPTLIGDMGQSVESDQDSIPSSPTRQETQAHITTVEQKGDRSAFVRSTIRLGIQAGEALQHAHDLGVLHRDIKPGNLMLDAEGQLYITDFGLARIETDVGVTMTGDLIGTLRYMSPEQALAKRVVMDHRSDIYSLGVTLYELLTLRPAFDGASRQELLNQIAFEDPPRPCQISQSIPRELETIVLKAIEKNPDERYATAQELADDLLAFLEDRPIKAKPPNLIQRTAKWSRRHKSLVWSAGVSSALLLVGMVVLLAVSNRYITGERIEKTEALAAKTEALAEKEEALLAASTNLKLAEQREAEAIREAKRATLTVELLEEVFYAANPNSANAAEYSVRELLDGFGSDLDERLKDYPGVEAEIRMTIGKAYYRLWENEKAESHFAKALRLRRTTATPEELAEALLEYGLALIRTDLPRAEPLIRESLKVYRELDQYSDGVLKAMQALQLYMIQIGKPNESDAIAEEALAIARASDKMKTAIAATILHNYGASKRIHGDIDQAIELLSDAVALHLRTHGNDHPETAWALDHLTAALCQTGNYSEAESRCRDCLAVRRRLYGNVHGMVLGSLCSLGQIQQSLGEQVGAIRTYREAIDIHAQLQGQSATLSLHDRNAVEAATVSLVGLLGDQNQNADALELLSNFVPQTVSGYLGRAQYFERTGATAKAFIDYVHAVEVNPKHAGARRAVCEFCDKYNYYEDALIELDKSIGRHPENPGLKQVRSRVHERSIFSKLPR